MAGRPDHLDQRDYVQSLERGFSVILAFADRHPRLTLSEVATATGLSRPTARRLLLTLEALGYVRTENRSFSLTPHVLALGYAYLNSLDLTGGRRAWPASPPLSILQWLSWSGAIGSQLLATRR